MNGHDNPKRFTIRQLGWLGIYMGIGLAIVFLLPFPVDMIILFGVLFVISFFRGRMRFMQRYGGKGGIRDLFGSGCRVLLR